jgi:hypothetical protein
VAGERRAASFELGIVGRPVPNALAAPSPTPVPRPADRITGALVVRREECGLTVEGIWTEVLDGVGTTTGVTTGVTVGVVDGAGVGEGVTDGVDTVNVGVPEPDDEAPVPQELEHRPVLP